MNSSVSKSLALGVGACLLIGAGALALVAQQVGKEKAAGKFTIVYSSNRIGEIEPCG